MRLHKAKVAEKKAVDAELKRQLRGGMTETPPATLEEVTPTPTALPLEPYPYSTTPSRSPGPGPNPCPKPNPNSKASA